MIEFSRRWKSIQERRGEIEKSVNGRWNLIGLVGKF